MVGKWQTTLFKKQQPDYAELAFCENVRSNMDNWLICKTRDASGCQQMKSVIHKLRDNCHKDLKSGIPSYHAGRVLNKTLQIATFNFQDWNERRRGQQLRRLEEVLTEFEMNLWRFQQDTKPPKNVVPIRP